MFQNLFKRHFSKTFVTSAKKSKSKNKSPCGAKKQKPPKKPCTPSTEACKKIKTSADICKKDPPKPKHGGGPGLWKFISCGICLPAVIILSIATLTGNEEPNGRPPFKKYDYMRIRTKPFPWGDGNHTLFHNPCYNALPEGYEDDKCDEETLNAILKKSEEEEVVVTSVC